MGCARLTLDITPHYAFPARALRVCATNGTIETPNLSFVGRRSYYFSLGFLGSHARALLRVFVLTRISPPLAELCLFTTGCGLMNLWLSLKMPMIAVVDFAPWHAYTALVLGLSGSFREKIIFIAQARGDLHQNALRPAGLGVQRSCASLSGPAAAFNARRGAAEGYKPAGRTGWKPMFQLVSWCESN
jgi:hypothetical protein